MARPCKLDTVEFQRKLSDQDRAILLAAGAGDLTRGFKELLSIYTALHNAGFRPGDSVEAMLFSDNENAISLAD
jgi:hypothetical protein